MFGFKNSKLVSKKTQALQKQIFSDSSRIACHLECDTFVTTNLKFQIFNIFPDLRDRKITLFWKDENEELIAFSSDEELIDALANNPEKVFNITIKVLHFHFSFSYEDAVT